MRDGNRGGDNNEFRARSQSQGEPLGADIVRTMSPRTSGHRFRPIRRVAPFVAVALLASACASAEAAPATTEAPATTTTRVPAPPIPTTTAPSTTTTTVEANPYASRVPDVGPYHSLVALTLGETQVYASPGTVEPTTTIPETTILGTQTVLGVLEVTEDGWALVQLPIRPNGSTGWVHFDAIEFYVVEGRIVVDLSEKKLVYYVDGEEVLSSSIAVGTNRNPTPTGEFFVTDSVELGDPNSPWGPHALGISAYSETITEYNGGPGIIGIHGTNKPSSIGKAASLGCVRLPNDLITQLYALVTLGTPVEIKA